MDIQFVVTAVITVIVAAYFAWASHTAGRVKALAQIVELTEAVNVAVRAADSFYQKTDTEKYVYVFAEAKRFMSDRGVSIPDDILRQLIEGAVRLIHRAQTPD